MSRSTKDSRLKRAGVSGYNKPKRTPNHPTKSHIVVAKEGDKKLMTKETLVKTVNEFGTYGPSIYKKHNLADVAKTFVEIAEAAQKHVVDETQDWFDGVTVKRNMNELKKQATQFNKIATEAQALQDRMAALYEDMGGILNRYFDIRELNEED